MATFFLDSSALVKNYVRETGSTWITSILDAAQGNSIHLARITSVEVVAALVRRHPPFTQTDLAQCLLSLDRDMATRFQIVPIDRTLLERAKRLAAQHRLRGYDAVQLAAALRVRSRNRKSLRSDPVLVSADSALNRAALAEGFTVDDPNLHP